MSRIIFATVFILAGTSLSALSHAAESIAYRLPKWKTLHFDDSTKASQHLAAVKKLGCEAKKDNHGGHIDVSYRTSKWQSLEVANDKLAHQWEAWLKGAGFETLHGHSHSHAGNNHAGHNHGPHTVEKLAYRMANWKTLHLKSDAQAEEFLALMKGFGCEVATEAHSGHVDTRVRCREWKEIEFPSHRVAQSWQSWLAKYGFEVKHSH